MDTSYWHQTVAVVTASFLGIPYGMAQGYPSPVANSMIADGVLTEEEFYFFTAVFDIGSAVGAALSLLLVARLSRKSTVLLSTIPGLVGWTLIATTSSALPLDIGRTLTGISSIWSSIGGHIYCAEVTSPNIRGFLGVTFLVLLTTGILVNYLLEPYLSWRYLALTAGLLHIVPLITFSFMPKSPRWLLSRGLNEPAREALRWLRGGTADISKEYEEISSSLNTDGKMDVDFRKLAKPRFYKPMLVSLLLIVAAETNGQQPVISYTVTILSDAGLGGAETMFAIISSSVNLACAFLSGVVIEKFGRRPISLIGMGGNILATVSVGLAFFLNEVAGLGNVGWLAVAGLILNGVASYLGLATLHTIIITELLPTDLRGVGFGVTLMFRALYLFIVLEIFPYMVNESRYGAFWGFSGALVGFLIFLAVFLPETKGKTLEEIEQIFDGTGYQVM